MRFKKGLILIVKDKKKIYLIHYYFFEINCDMIKI